MSVYPSNQFDTGTSERHVVLVSPEVHWNTGNIGRTCLGADAHLHLIRPLGFSLDDRQVKRAGLDYWPNVKLSVWDDFEQFVHRMKPDLHDIAFLTKYGAHPYWGLPVNHRVFLVFGSETKGLPQSLRDEYADQTYHIPIQTDIRCLNLSTAVGIVLYDSLRRQVPRLSL